MGEIWIKSAVTLKGYWKDPHATDEAYSEGRDDEGRGWFRTGGAGYMSEGFLFIHDRVKDMIISGAENIYPADVENALTSHPVVADVAVIGVPDEKWGETVKRIIAPAAGADPTDADLIEHCRERLAHYRCPTSVDRVEMIPRNPSGKILKTELRKAKRGGLTSPIRSGAFACQSAKYCAGHKTSSSRIVAIEQAPHEFACCVQSRNNVESSI